MRQDCSTDQILETTKKILKILASNDEHEWQFYIKNLLSEYQAATNKPEIAKKFIQMMMSGMESFSDLVLHKNHKPLIEENSVLRFKGDICL